MKGSAEDPRTRELGRKISSRVGCARAGAEEIRPASPTEDAPRRRFAAVSEGLDRLTGPGRSSKTHAIADFTAQSGKTYDTTPAVANSCKRGKGGKHGKGKGRHPSHRMGTSHR